MKKTRPTPALKLGRSSNATKLVSNPNLEAEAVEVEQAVLAVCFKTSSAVWAAVTIRLHRAVKVPQQVAVQVAEAVEVLQASSMISNRVYSLSSMERAHLQEARRSLTR